MHVAENKQKNRKMLSRRLLICLALLSKIISGTLVIQHILQLYKYSQIICRCAKCSQMQTLQLICNIVEFQTIHLRPHTQIFQLAINIVRQPTRKPLFQGIKFFSRLILILQTVIINRKNKLTLSVSGNLRYKHSLDGYCLATVNRRACNSLDLP